MDITTLLHNKATLDGLAAEKKADSDYHKRHYAKKVKKEAEDDKTLYAKVLLKKQGYTTYVPRSMIQRNKK